MAEVSMMDLTKQALDLWGLEAAEAANIADPAKKGRALARAQEKFIQALKNGKVSQSVIDAFSKFVEAAPSAEAEAIKALTAMTTGRISNLQALQKEQAEMTMRMRAQPEQMKASIASFAAAISTICRFFGADDIAIQTEAKTKEITDSIKVELDASAFRNTTQDSEILAQAAQNMADMFDRSNAGRRAAELAKQSPQNLPTPMDPYQMAPVVPGTSAAPSATIASRATWDNYKKAFSDIGLSGKEIEGMHAAWIKAAALKDNKSALDTPEDLKAFLEDKAVVTLPKDKQDKIRAMQNIPGLHITGTHN